MKTELLRLIVSSLSHVWRRRFSSPSSTTALVALFLFLPYLMQSAAPPAGTSIGNQASATYTDASNTKRTATSNVAITIVQQVSSFSIAANGSRYSSPGGQVVFPHTIVNTGNGTDTFSLNVVNNPGGDDFDLSSLALYADANGDGLPDNSTPINTSGPLAAGATFKFVAVGSVPGSANAPQTAGITVTAQGTATGTPAPAASNADTATVSANGVINVTKAMSASSGAAGSGPYTVTLTYNNTGNNSATNVTLMDDLPVGMNFLTNSARWSVTGGSADLTDANNADSQGTAPDTIQFDYSITTPGRVRAVIGRVIPGQSGTVTFQVNIAPGQSSGPLNNTVTYSYDPGTGTPLGPFNGNTVQFSVGQTTGVNLTGQTVASVSQGGTVVFTNVVQNTGNGTDSFDITVTNSTFPPGTTFTVYQSDGNTPLVDSTGNGTPDSGPRAAGATYNVILKAALPTSASGIGVNYTVQITATSASSPSTTASANDVLTSVTASTVDLSNGASGGAGPGPEGAPVVSTAANPGATTRFTLQVANTSAVSDSYNLSYSTNSGFSTATLPAGWSVVFRDGSGAIITSTGLVPNGTNRVVFADVTAGPGAAPGANSIYFRVVSPTSGATDILHDAVVVNTVRNLSLAPPNSAQVFPGSVVVYSHLLVNNGNVLEGDGVVSGTTLGLANSISGWSAVVYYDANNSGTVDGGDSVVTNLNFVSAGVTGVAPGESIRLLVQVFAPAGAPLGAVNTTTLTATTANGTYLTTVPPAVAVADSSTVISGDLRIVKEQAIDTDTNGVPDTAYSTTDITTGALPGKAIRYRITVTNIGAAPATSVRVFDSTPTYTIYTAIGPAGITPGTVVTVPADGTAGALEFDLGTLTPGASAVITFGVLIIQ